MSSTIAISHTRRRSPAATRPRVANRAPTRLTYLWRRTAALAVLLVFAFVLTVGIGRVGAGAELADNVAGSVVVNPGETLWDVAVATAPKGMDPRRQLADIRELNALTSSEIAAWTVVLVPAR